MTELIVRTTILNESYRRRSKWDEPNEEELAQLKKAAEQNKTEAAAAAAEEWLIRILENIFGESYFWRIGKIVHGLKNSLGILRNYFGREREWDFFGIYLGFF